MFTSLRSTMLAHTGTSDSTSSPSFSGADNKQLSASSLNSQVTQRRFWKMRTERHPLEVPPRLVREEGWLAYYGDNQQRLPVCGAPPSALGLALSSPHVRTGTRSFFLPEAERCTDHHIRFETGHPVVSCWVGELEWPANRSKDRSKDGLRDISTAGDLSLLFSGVFPFYLNLPTPLGRARGGALIPLREKR